MFANAQIAWPPALAEMWRILSAFNLNIDIVAWVWFSVLLYQQQRSWTSSYILFLFTCSPECLVPDVGYIHKWAAFEAIPFLVAASFMIVHGALFLYKRSVLRQRSWPLLMSHVDTLIASFLTLFFFIFLQLFKMQVCVFSFVGLFMYVFVC